MPKGNAAASADKKEKQDDLEQQDIAPNDVPAAFLCPLSL